MGKSSINGPFSMAMLNNQMVYVLDEMPDIPHFHPILSNSVSFRAAERAEDFHQDPAPTSDEFDQGGQTVPGTYINRGPFQVSSGDDE